MIYTHINGASFSPHQNPLNIKGFTAYKIQPFDDSINNSLNFSFSQAHGRDKLPLNPFKEGSMGKFAKILGLVIILFLLSLGGLYFVANKYLTPERVKGLVVPPLEEATGLKVKLGEIHRKGLAGVQITELRFMEPSRGEEILAVDEMRLGLKLTPLLKGRLVVTEATFVRPKMVLIREKDGSFNLAKIFASKGEETKAEKKPSRLALVFQSIKIEDASLSFKDLRGEYPPAHGKFSLYASLALSGGRIAARGKGDFALIVADYPLIKNLGFELESSGEETRLRITSGEILQGKAGGMVTLSGEELAGSFKLSKASFEEVSRLAGRLKPYFFPEAELPPLAGEFDLKGAFEKKARRFTYQVSFDPAPLKTKLEDVALKVSGKIVADQTKARPDIKIVANGQPLNLKGEIKLSPKIPSLDLLISAEHLDLMALAGKKSTPAASSPPEKTQKEKPKPLPALPVAGKVRFRAQEVCYRACAKEVKATLLLSPQEVNLKELSLLLAGAITQASAKVTGLTAKPKLRFAYSLAGADLPLLLNDFLPESNYFTSGRVWSEGTFWGKGLSAEELKKTLSGQGRAKFLQLGLKETPASSLVAKLLNMPALKKLTFDKGELVLTLKDGLADVRGKFSREGLEALLVGKISLDGRLDLKPSFLFTGEMAKTFARRFPGASLFKTQKGYEVSVSITGTFEEPKVSLLHEVGKKIEKKAIEKLFKFLGE